MPRPKPKHDPDMPPHDKLVQVATDLLLTLTFEKSTVTAQWTTNGKPKGQPLYSGVIKVKGMATNYSLYTLGIQGRLWCTKLTLTSGSAVLLQPGGWEKPLVKNKTVTIRATGVKDHDGRQIPDEKGIWFIRFSGKIEVDLESKRRRHFKPDQPGIRTGHDIAPPPPDPGGEEGDGEEE